MKDSEKELTNQETTVTEPQEKPDWELHPENYKTNPDGSFVLKKDGTPAKKAGAKHGQKMHWHSETKAKMAARRSVREKKKEITQLEQKLARKRASLNKVTTVTKKLDGDLGVTAKKSTIVSEVDLDYLPENTKRLLVEDESRIIFRPNPGPQTDFLAADEKEVLYGGAAGGGKSYAMLIDPLRYAEEKDHRALILRKTLPELTELIDKSRELYPKAYPGAKFNESKKTWVFPSGCKIQFGYCERDADVYQYQGQAYTWIGFDELTHMPTSFAWDYLRSRLRTTNPRIKTYMRATTNPGGPGHAWVKQRFVEPAEPGSTFWDHTGKISRKFIPARLSDNPSLASTGEYQSMLESLDEVQRRRLLDGDWDINEGAAFPEFDTSLHVIPPMDIPNAWTRVKAIDYGYRAPSCCLWGAIDPEDGTIIIYRELYERGLDGQDLSNKIHDMELGEVQSITGVLDGASWNITGASGPTVGECLVRAGHKLRRADKNRLAGKIQVHERLRINQKTGRPKLQIFSTCVNLIREITSIPADPNNREDVDTKAEDHAYDALRYLVMSRPRLEDPMLRMMRFKMENFEPADSAFGY